MFIRYAVGAIASNPAGQRAVWAKRDRKARIAKNMPAVEAAITAHSPDALAQQAERNRIARELTALRAEIAVIKAQQEAVNSCRAAWPTAVTKFNPEKVSA